MEYGVLILLPVACALAIAGLFWRRPDLAERWVGLVEPRRGSRPGVLFYAASHGELLLLEKLLPRLAEQQPDAELMVVVPRPSVLQLARERLPLCRSYCVMPLVPGAHGRVLARLAPEFLVIVEFARIPLWRRAAARRGVPTMIINGRISAKNARACRRWPWLFRPLVRGCELILAQTPDDAATFRRYGASETAIQVAGAMKFETAPKNRRSKATRRLAALAGIGEDDIVLLAGSTTGNEEEIAARVFEQLAPDYPQLRLILVPKSRRRFSRVARMLARRGLAFQRRSQLESQGAHPASRVLLVDTIGELAAWWGTAHIGFVGASLACRGGHNMIEPAALGVATCFGSHTDNFRDVASALLGYDAAVRVASGAELRSFVRRCLDQPQYAAALGERARAVCRSQGGTIDRTCQRLAELLREQCRPVIIKLTTAAAPRQKLRQAA